MKGSLAIPRGSLVGARKKRLVDRTCGSGRCIVVNLVLWSFVLAIFEPLVLGLVWKFVAELGEALGLTFSGAEPEEEPERLVPPRFGSERFATSIVMAGATQCTASGRSVVRRNHDSFPD
jgi:hypothetical protein